MNDKRPRFVITGDAVPSVTVVDLSNIDTLLPITHSDIPPVSSTQQAGAAGIALAKELSGLDEEEPLLPFIDLK